MTTVGPYIKVNAYNETERSRLRHITMINISQDRLGNNYYFSQPIECNIKSKSTTVKLYNTRNSNHYEMVQFENTLYGKVLEHSYGHNIYGLLSRLRWQYTGRVFGTYRLY